MKNSIIALAVIVLVIMGGLFFVRQAQSPAREKPVVGATIYPVYDMVQAVAGDQFDTVLLLPPGSSPHTYEPIPSVLAQIEGGEMIFGIGHGLDTWAQSIASAARTDFMALDSGVALQEFAHDEEHDDHEEDEHGEEGHEEDEHDHEHEGVDPHYWLNPANAAIMVDSIATQLGMIDPANANLYQERADTWKSRLTRFDESFVSRLADVQDTPIITFHDAFGYFASYYGITIAATVEPFAGQQPTPQYLAELQEVIAQTQAKALFLEPQLSTQGIEQFATDNDLTIGTLDPIGGVDARDSYIGLLQYNIEQLREAIK